MGTEGAAGEEVEEGVGAGNFVWWDGEETTPPTLSFSRTLGSRGGDPSIAQRRVSYFDRMKDSILLERLNQSELDYLDRELLLNTHWSGGICPALRCLSQYMLARLFPHFWIDYVPSR